MGFDTTGDTERKDPPWLERILYGSFIPKSLSERPELLPRLRTFLLSHLIGPVIGLVLAGYLIALQGGTDWRVLTIILSVLAFWFYPTALRLTARFTLLALLSLQHLTFIILFASYHYGGIGSPFFFWLAMVPLFGFFYLGDIPRLHIAIIAGLAISIALYFASYRIAGPPPGDLSLNGNTIITLLSVLGAGLYAMAMALSHARLLRQQTELMRKSEAQRLIAEQLLFAKEAAEAASRAKSEFLATTSHELRTPLNAIIGFASLLRNQHEAPGSTKSLGYLRDIESSGKHLLEMINDLLDVAKAESGRFQLEEEEFDPRQVLASSLRLVRSRAAKNALKIHVAVPMLPRLQADPRRLKQVFVNLLGNAIKFTPQGGTISVTAIIEADGGLAVSIADTGIGIEKEKITQILQPFFQVDNSLARRNDGLGLGLSLVSNVMARHGGTLEVASTLGQGTVVTIRFPAQRVVVTDQEHRKCA